MDLHASAKTESFTPGGILADGEGLQQKVVTLPDGTAALAQGTLLGKVLVGAAVSAAKAGGNTGAGTLTMDVVTPVLPGAKVGVYKARCVVTAGNGGTFEVEDPDGFVLGRVAVGETFQDDLKFVIADVGADFILGDGFDITVAAGSGKYVKSLAAATDGSQVPDAILAHDVGAADGADLEAVAIIGGSINKDYLVLGAGHTVASIADALRVKGIYLR